MQSIETLRFGLVRFEEHEVIEFPAGLPGFEQEFRFLLIEAEESRPLKFLQSISSPQLSFVCAPLALVFAGYEATLPKSDRELLAMPPEGGAPSGGAPGSGAPGGGAPGGGAPGGGAPGSGAPGSGAPGSGAPDTVLEWLAILCFARPDAPTANLLGPLVIRRDVGLGVQSIREDSRYSARQPLFAAAPPVEQALCS